MPQQLKAHYWLGNNGLQAVIKSLLLFFWECCHLHTATVRCRKKNGIWFVREGEMYLPQFTSKGKQINNEAGTHFKAKVSSKRFVELQNVLGRWVLTNYYYYFPWLYYKVEIHLRRAYNCHSISIFILLTIPAPFTSAGKNVFPFFSRWYKWGMSTSSTSITKSQVWEGCRNCPLTAQPLFPISGCGGCAGAVSVFLNVRVISEQGLATQALDCAVWELLWAPSNLSWKVLAAAYCCF